MEKNNDFYKSFKELKKKHPDAVFLFRNKEYYVAYNEDATEVAKTLGTRKEQKEGKMVTSFAMTKLDVNLPKLIRAGYRIAICEDIDNHG